MTLPKASEQRAFQIHPAILKSIIHEQAGSVDKAIAELIMNCVDAGATRVDITHNAEGIVVSDDGRGFQSREEILAVFETFGLPHEEGDATYGRFRVGRGQVMAFGKVSWRSGYFEMVADLAGNEDTLGYELIEHTDSLAGCTVTISRKAGNGYERPYGALDANVYALGRMRRQLSHMVKYVDVPVFYNSDQINFPPTSPGLVWTQEDNNAYYSLSRTDWELLIYNQGVFVDSLPATHYGTGGVVSTKQPLMLNMARTSINHACPVWGSVSVVLKEHLQSRLNRLQVLKDAEIPALLELIVHEHDPIPPAMRRKIRELRFIEDIFGTKREPNKMLAAERFSVFDGVHTNIAERVHRSGRAVILMPSLFDQIDMAPESLDNIRFVLRRLIDRLDINLPNLQYSIIDFEHFVQDLDDTVGEVGDNELKPDEKLVLKTARAINQQLYKLSGARGGTRHIRAGVSDTAEGWTDGLTTIWINRTILESTRYKEVGISKLISLIVHEYCHERGSMGDHVHGYDFLSQFHEAVMSPAFGAAVESFYRRYASGLCREGIKPSSEHGSFFRRIAELAPQLRRRSP